jgi:hypothetical protein
VRLERDSAKSFMYASLRLHRGRDHCPRNDFWGLLYGFCDLVSGGLSWMGYASARDRSSCQLRSSGSVKVSRNSRSISVDQIIVLLGGEAGRSLVAHRIA